MYSLALNEAGFISFTSIECKFGGMMTTCLLVYIITICNDRVMLYRITHFLKKELHKEVNSKFS